MLQFNNIIKFIICMCKIRTRSKFFDNNLDTLKILLILFKYHHNGLFYLFNVISPFVFYRKNNRIIVFLNAEKK